jgi:hypothetical protein
MLTAPLTALSIRYLSVVYVNSSFHIFKQQTTDGHLMLKNVREAVNINY